MERSRVRNLDQYQNSYLRHIYGIAIAILVIAILALAAAVIASAFSGVNNTQIKKISDDDDDSGSSSSSSGGGWDKCPCHVKSYQSLLFCDPYNGAQGVFDPSTLCPYFPFADPTIPFVANDGVIKQGEDSVTITANPYNLTLPYSPAGTFSHVKNLNLLTRTLPVGSGETVRVDMKMRCQVYIPSTIPFPSYLIADPKEDPRLSSCAFNVVDLQTLMIFDFIKSAHKRWCLYERLRAPASTFRAFTSIKYAGKTSSTNELDDLSIEYDRFNKRVNWYVDGEVVCSVTDIGTPSSDFHIVLDLGGTNEIVEPTSVTAGAGLFTLQDMTDFNNASSNEGLVKLVNTTGFYTFPTMWFNEDGDEDLQLFGSGGRLTLENLKAYVQDVVTTSSSSSSSSEKSGKHKRDITFLDSQEDSLSSSSEVVSMKEKRSTSLHRMKVRSQKRVSASAA